MIHHMPPPSTCRAESSLHIGGQFCCRNPPSCTLHLEYRKQIEQAAGRDEGRHHTMKFWHFLLLCRQARLHYAAFSPQLVQPRMNRRACRHKSKKCQNFYLRQLLVQLPSLFQMERSHSPKHCHTAPRGADLYYHQ